MDSKQIVFETIDSLMKTNHKLMMDSNGRNLADKYYFQYMALDHLRSVLEIKLIN